MDSTKYKNVMEFYPTFDDLKDFSKYVEQMESEGAHNAGVVKLIPPSNWVPRKSGYDFNQIDMNISTPISQLVLGQKGQYQILNMEKRSMKLNEYKRLAESNEFKTPNFKDFDDLEYKFWKNIRFIPAIYAADVDGTLVDPDVDKLNINKLGTILDNIEEDCGIKIKGVNTSYLYFGMWKSSFAWHTEDMNLYSINYLHYGAPKVWYVIPPDYSDKFERLSNSIFGDIYSNCKAYLRHKTTLISPQCIRNANIIYNKVIQHPGEFIITFPNAYHAGFNIGFNVAEATNFATERWIEYGKIATLCHCRSDMVRISMEIFIKKFQPEKYNEWLLSQKKTEQTKHSNRTNTKRKNTNFKKCQVKITKIK